jgi:hypothetical protein
LEAQAVQGSGEATAEAVVEMGMADLQLVVVVTTHCLM